LDADVVSFDVTVAVEDERRVRTCLDDLDDVPEVNKLGERAMVVGVLEVSEFGPDLDVALANKAVGFERRHSSSKI
jgi:hypothetical protein